MSILRNVIGDITSPSNPCDIIIGMNSQLTDVTGIGFRFVKDVIPLRALELGSVISYDFDDTRKLHMIICHDLGHGGWRNSDKHVRFALDYLNHLNKSCRKHSIVEIGTGRIGKRDGADAPAIRTAVANSYLEVDVYIYEPPPEAREPVVTELTLPFRAWSPDAGQITLANAA